MWLEAAVLYSGGQSKSKKSKSGNRENKVTARKFTTKLTVRKKQKGSSPRAFEIGFYLFPSSPQIDVSLKEAL